MFVGPFPSPPGLENMHLALVTGHGVRAWVNKETGDFKLNGIDTVGAEGARYVRDALDYLSGEGEYPNAEDYDEPEVSIEDIRDLLIQDIDDLVEMNNK